MPLPAQVKWMLDSITLSGAFIRNGRLDVIGVNALGRALHAPMFDSPTARGGRANFARYHFLDPGSQDFFPDWEDGAAATVALLRAEAGRAPYDKALRELIGELTTVSEQFSAFWSAHDIRIRHEGLKRLNHPEVGDLELTYQSTVIPLGRTAWHDLTFYTSEPGSADEERLRLLASWNATGDDEQDPADGVGGPRVRDSRSSR